MSFSVKNRVALVTGSSRGLGKQIAYTLGKAGAKVCFNYTHDRERAAATFAEFKESDGQGILVRADVTDEKEIQSAIAEIEATLGSVDILVVNATVPQPEKSIEDYDWTFYQSMIDFFIKSPFLLTKSVLPNMKKKKWGRIINIGSEVFQTSPGNYSAYVAAKGGQVGWTRSMATELAPFGITVNLIAPGWIPVERHEQSSQTSKDAYLSTIPAGRWGLPQDVANTVLYFASEEASFISGQTLCVNGGKTPW